jgi:hypothetical protein
MYFVILIVVVKLGLLNKKESDMRRVRNFFVTGTVDGQASEIRRGPQGKNGGFSLTVNVRENGDISNKSLIVNGFSQKDGTLRLEVLNSGRLVHEIITER